MGRLVETAHAKINLALDVGEGRPDGYHEIHSVMQSLELGDIVVLEERAAGVSLDCLPGDPVKQGALQFVGSEPEPMPPSDCRNLAWQAAEHLMDAAGVRRGLNITIRKAIPVSAGLGGGSADAAAVLRGLNRLWNLGLTIQELAAIGEKIGADIPFCLSEGTAEVSGIGEKIEAVPSPPPWPVILLKPPVAVSTAACYAAYDELPQRVAVDVSNLLTALSEQNIQAVAKGLGNSLEAVTLQRFPDLIRWEEMMENAGCLGVLMSGSGPTFFGLARDLKEGTGVFMKLVDSIKQEQRRPLPNLYFTRLWSDRRVRL
ncbi:MAG: 4-(cytidine 5'-diphospho)-2-C-methyl-D-erythritol kinase [Firmicutes bacterium]|nr:4-(cytidine 5'-diphospho)-2-C-methyl-D-erythritol kinase [Bacillota bacterium]